MAGRPPPGETPGEHMNHIPGYATYTPGALPDPACCPPCHMRVRASMLCCCCCHALRRRGAGSAMLVWGVCVCVREGAAAVRERSIPEVAVATGELVPLSRLLLARRCPARRHMLLLRKYGAYEGGAAAALPAVSRQAGRLSSSEAGSRQTAGSSSRQAVRGRIQAENRISRTPPRQTQQQAGSGRHSRQQAGNQVSAAGRCGAGRCGGRRRYAAAAVSAGARGRKRDRGILLSSQASSLPPRRGEAGRAVKVCRRWCRQWWCSVQCVVVVPLQCRPVVAGGRQLVAWSRWWCRWCR